MAVELANLIEIKIVTYPPFGIRAKLAMSLVEILNLRS